MGKELTLLLRKRSPFQFNKKPVALTRTTQINNLKKNPPHPPPYKGGLALNPP